MMPLAGHKCCERAPTDGGAIDFGYLTDSEVFSAGQMLCYSLNCLILIVEKFVLLSSYWCLIRIGENSQFLDQFWTRDNVLYFW